MLTKPVCLLMILDGWGIGENDETNAIYMARTPNLDRLEHAYPHTRLACSGEAVGLPSGIMGNSEVGHLNIGAGRIVYQDLLRIDKSIEDGSFFQNPVLCKVMEDVRACRGALHLMGLVSDGGVHSQLSHVFALLDMARKKGLTRVFIHAVLDGRDTPPDSGITYIRRLVKHLQQNGIGRIADICGRFYAMDRDTRWERTRKAYEMVVNGIGLAETDPVEAVKNAYTRGETDEFVRPVVMVDSYDRPLATEQNGDGMIFFNFRADRARQITRAFTETEFDRFVRGPKPAFCTYACMTVYDETFDLPAAFPPEHLKDILGEVVSQNGLSQLRIAETEKYAHVTYFFNGGEEKSFPGEDRCLIPSPRDIETYDKKPQMSAPEVTKELIRRIRTDKYDLIVLNFANMDMVGHTGNMQAAVSACETLDICVGEIVASVLDRKGTVLITADHGNAEKMISQNASPHTAHTLNKVPFFLVDDRHRQRQLKSGGALCDIAPTLLKVLNLPKPGIMTGKSLIM
ncbi:MAG: 2,3-bisphosphoglycerate-independent phosphoglycerate mutase [Desulfobacterales bacterium]